MVHSHREFRTQDIPTAYLISFRAYGAWLHGDKRRSADRFHIAIGVLAFRPTGSMEKYNLASLKQPPVRLGSQCRAAIEKAIRETCKIRGWVLLVFNARSNHIHTVVSVNSKPEPILNAFKANATREIREAGCWHRDRSPWIPLGSKKYLWDDESVSAAVAYVLYEQGEPLL